MKIFTFSVLGVVILFLSFSCNNKPTYLILDDANITYEQAQINGLNQVFNLYINKKILEMTLS